MRKERIINVPCRKKTGELEYLIIEHSAIGPADFLGDLINKYSLGVLWLGHDGPSMLSLEESKRLINGMRSENIQATLNSGLIWVGHDECPKLYQQKWFTLEGDSIILKSKSPEEEINCERLPKPSGFRKDKISSKDNEILESILSGNDVYIYDDFTESFVVSKNTDALDTILEQIERIKR